MDHIVTTDYDGPDRRTPTGFDLQVTLAKLIARVETVEQNIATKLEALEVVHESSNRALESKVDVVLARLEAQVVSATSCADDAASDAAEALRVTGDQEHKLMRFETTGRGVISTLTEHDKAIKNLNGRVAVLENTPGAVSLKFLKWAAGIVGTAILVGLVGLIWWALSHPEALAK